MAIESAADRAVFLNPSEFGEVIAWTVGAVTTDVAGVPDTGTLRLDMDDGPGVIGRHAALICSVADMPPGAMPGNAVLFRSVAHRVKSIEPDGTGMAVVRLEETIGS